MYVLSNVIHSFSSYFFRKFFVFVLNNTYSPPVSSTIRLCDVLYTLFQAFFPISIWSSFGSVEGIFSVTLERVKNLQRCNYRKWRMVFVL